MRQVGLCDSLQDDVSSHFSPQSLLVDLFPLNHLSSASTETLLLNLAARSRMVLLRCLTSVSANCFSGLMHACASGLEPLFSGLVLL